MAPTRKQLRRYVESGNLAELDEIKGRLFSFDRCKIDLGLRIATQIHGLGTAGASGLLAVLFPADFGTVDQFAVRALVTVPDLRQNAALSQMKPGNLRTSDGVVLIEIMREKARELNARFSTQFWTPRRIDMVLWVCNR